MDRAPRDERADSLNPCAYSYNVSQENRENQLDESAE